MAEKFASKANDDIATMLADKDSISTKKSIKHAIKVLREYFQAIKTTADNCWYCNAFSFPAMLYFSVLWTLDR